jgi:hypothetical protein
MNLFSFNPEIQRNAWLELSLIKVALLPVLFILVLYLFVIYSTQINSGYDGSYSMILANTTFAMGLVFLNSVGLFKASNAVTDEANSGTWLLQRLTPVDPWRMSIGKLFGPSIIAWYGGIIGWVIIVLIAVVNSFSNAFYNNLIWIYIVGMVASMGIQAFVIFLTLFKINRVDIGLKIRSNRFRVVGIGFSFLAAWLLILLIGFVGSEESGLSLKWYNLGINPVSFFLFITFYFCGWSLFGLRHVMGSVLREKSTVYPIIYFILMNTLIFIGFSVNSTEPISQNQQIFKYIEIFNASLIFISLIFALLLEDKSLSTIHNVILRLRQNPRNWAIYAPAWMVIFVLGTGLIIGEFLISKAFSDPSSNEIVDRVFTNGMDIDNPSFVFSTIVSMLNWVVIFLFFGIVAKPKQADTFAIIYILLHSWVISLFLGGIFGLADIDNYLYQSAIITLVESGILLAITWVRYNSAVSLISRK